MNAAYRARTIKRDQRTAARVEQLAAQILNVLAGDHPQSVRHVFYRMTDPRLPEPVEKSDGGYRAVQDRCVKQRRSGRLPLYPAGGLTSLSLAYQSAETINHCATGKLAVIFYIGGLRPRWRPDRRLDRARASGAPGVRGRPHVRADRDHA